ncbi:hypothetical protein SAMN05216387_10781 [Nitrosovibrio tenuis]|uniref:Uncharacterized protein n=1 Tax=Nitrosovibrio tenuis TaxID=1233 RepID=A0A1H7NN80_9PROT|nr:hypothetical protein SAMN05216387_10781 [Nitrosovibrio tenuis]
MRMQPNIKNSAWDSFTRLRMESPYNLKGATNNQIIQKDKDIGAANDEPARRPFLSNEQTAETHHPSKCHLCFWPCAVTSPTYSYVIIVATPTLLRRRWCLILWIPQPGRAFSPDFFIVLSPSLPLTPHADSQV